MRYKVGDKVKVREWDDLFEEFKHPDYGWIDIDMGFNAEMAKFCGKEVTISGVFTYYYKLEEVGFAWVDCMFEEDKLEIL